MTLDINTPDLKELIKNHKEQILRRTLSGFHDNENFKQIHRLLISLHEQRKIHDFLIILISKEEVENVVDDINIKLFVSLNSDEALQHNHLIVDRNFAIVSMKRERFDDNNAARNMYIEISKTGFCVFMMTTTGVNYFLDGDEVGEAIFCTPEAEASYLKLKDLDQIHEVFEEYRYSLTLLNTYRKFFASTANKKAVYANLSAGKRAKLSEKEFLKRYIQLLNNKPENIFRDDLRHFLQDRLKAYLLPMEYILENFTRIDIFIQDDYGELYLIEVKWVGISIHVDGLKVNRKSVTAGHINPSGFIQSIQYIRQLGDENKKIKIGYLAVFDARKDDLPDTGVDFDENNLDEAHQESYLRFRKIPDFRVRNLQPSFI